MICNAAGGLLPSLAQQLHQTFGTVVLPCYGMTECMPISCPPIDYQLDRPGTSGIICGPEIQIFDDNGQHLTKSSKVGRIFVRGPPLFDGYENIPSTLTFTADGWFDTGDMGYLDENKFLYVTGRTKEVINSGGEIISPYEIEEAVVKNPRVRQALAFSVEHEILQETIGLVLVPSNPASRIGLTELRKFLSNSLHPSKWPQLIVYMNDLPKSQTNKPLRIGLAQRLQLKQLKDSDLICSRAYEAMAPPRTSSNNSLIPCQLVSFDKEQICSVFNSHPLIVNTELVNSVAYVVISEPLDKDAIWEYLDTRLHNYLRPKDIIILEEIPRENEKNILLDLLPTVNTTIEQEQKQQNPVDFVLIKIFSEIFNLEDYTKATLNSETDFFQVGGNSLKAGTLINRIRQAFGVMLPVMSVYSHRTIRSLRTLIEKQNPNLVTTLFDQQQQQNGTGKDPRNGVTGTDDYESSITVKLKSQTCSIALLVQLLSLILLAPLRIAVLCYLFIIILMVLSEHWKVSEPWEQVLQLVFAILLSRLISDSIVFPATSLLVKWLVIGKYRHGQYPLWEQYYLRWWFVDQTIRTFGFGIFELDSTLYIIFLKLMGAKIGKNVTIDSDAKIKEFDLVTIKSNVEIQRCVISPFTLSTGHMILAPIQIDNNCSIGLNARLSPGATIPDGTRIGPLSSSYKISTSSATEQEPLPSSPTIFNIVFQLLLGWPVVILVTMLSYIPWIALLPLLTDRSSHSMGLHSIMSIIYYFAHGKRVAFHLVALIARDTISPYIYIVCCILVKRLIIGKFREHEQEEQKSTYRSNIKRQIHLLRHWLMQKLLPGGDLNGFSRLVGTHYELISVVFRLLGARIGKRIYWPGSGLQFYEYDLLTVGDDVVFGSRCYLRCSNDEKTHSARITIKSGTMIADRCVLLPGVIVEENTIMGSGSLCKENSTYPAGSIWLGSRQGDAVLWHHGAGRKAALKTETITPFGRAFYEGEDTGYWVIPLGLHVIYNTCLNIFQSILWTTPIIASFQLIALVFRHESETSLKTTVQICAYTFFLFFVFLQFFYTAIVLLTMSIEILFKWLLFGRRQTGKYNWDKSSYCQRWQLFIEIQRLKRTVLQLFNGSFYLCVYYRCLGCRIGRNVCLYPSGADPMMSEPDLVTIGDDCCIDDASIICHLNTKGQFTLNSLVIGNRCVLRSQSRLMSGASMEDDSTLLEHTLVVSGERVDQGSVWQGCPATDVTRTFRE
ncbi:unnamed protein product [Rotaria sp. Silwood2]|nr:unnamed protein product [Rotaria sp. Silwood2]CAF4359709.1 unnamed protein product [Rotaria sp. Silwood2]